MSQCTLLKLNHFLWNFFLNLGQQFRADFVSSAGWFFFKFYKQNLPLISFNFNIRNRILLTRSVILAVSLTSQRWYCDTLWKISIFKIKLIHICSLNLFSQVLISFYNRCKSYSYETCFCWKLNIIMYTRTYCTVGIR